jgi:predicted ferric reductase
MDSRTTNDRNKSYAGDAAGLRPVLLVFLYLALVLAPIGLAYAQGLPPRKWQDELSSALALAAFAAILMEFVLSGRFRIVSGGIGIDTTMRFHQLMARWLTVLIVVHPFLYVTPLMDYPLPWDTTRRLTLGLSGASLTTGLIAWLGLMVMVLLAIFREQRDTSYEAWRLSHGIAAVLVALLGAHHTIDAGRYSTHPALAAFWLCLIGLALFTLLWVYALKPAWQLRNPYEVRSVRQIALKTWELIVAPKQGATIAFSASQFVWLNVGHSPFSLYENPFSIASAPSARNQLGFVVKEVGDFTRSLGRLTPGTIAYVDGPHGNLTLPGRTGSGIALIAGGVGMAPLLGILRQLRHDRDRRAIVVLYGNRVREQIVYADELSEMRADLSLRVEHVLGEPPPEWQGRAGVIDAEVLGAVFSGLDVRSWLFFVCGPLPMIESVEKALLSMGVPGRQIVSERFYYD